MTVLSALSLRPEIRIRLHAQQRVRLQYIEEEDYAGVTQKTREHFAETGRIVTEEYLAAGVYALKQYYAVAMLDPANAHAVSLPLDPFWHAHILHTERYMAFCDRVVGEYMHHLPLDHGIAAHVSAVRRLYDYTIETLDWLFVENDESFWPRQVTDRQLICLHKGNTQLYGAVQPYRIFEPNARGIAYAA